MLTHRTFAFSRRLLDAMGIGSALLALPVAACGGKVVVEHEGGGGAGATSSASSTTTSTVTTATSSSVTNATSSTSTGTPFTCDVPLGPDAELVYHCTSAAPGPDGCPAASEDSVLQALSADLNEEDCANSCCTGQYVEKVPCGPDPYADGCCYYALVQRYDICEGRPFVIDDEARTAAVTSRDDWRAVVAPDLGGLSDTQRRALAAAWETDAAFEHASIASFAKFAMELLSLGAPASLVRGAQQAMADEIEHAALCFGLASAYAGEARGPAELPIDGAFAGPATATAMITAVVREGCIGETLAALVAQEAMDAASDPAVRAALHVIAEDEARHAELAWRVVAWATERGDDAMKRAIEKAFSGDLAESAAKESGLDEATGRAHGQLSAAAKRVICERGLAEIVRPCASALLGARAAARREGASAATA